MSSPQALAEKTTDMPAETLKPASAAVSSLALLNDYLLAKKEQLERDKKEQKKTEEKQKAQAARLSEKAMASVPRAKDMEEKERDHVRQVYRMRPIDSCPSILMIELLLTYCIASRHAEQGKL